MATRTTPTSRPAAASKTAKAGTGPATKTATKTATRPTASGATPRAGRAAAAKASPAAAEPARKSPSKPTAARVAAAKSTLTKRGRPPKRVFINVLVRETTRTALTRLKVSGKLASQGEVIDQLVQQLLGKTGNG